MVEAIDNKLGIFVKIAEATKRERYTSYAHICVYLDILNPLPGELCLVSHDEEWVETIDYEHIPFRCHKCHMHGHIFKDFPLTQ